MIETVRRGCVGLLLAVFAASWAGAQTHGTPEEFSAVAIANDEFGAGAGRLLIRVNRWSTEAERERLLAALRQEGSKALLEELRDARSVGTIRTPDSLAYDLRYASQTLGADGGRDIMIVTDRPLQFWESFNNARTLDYPFSVIQMHIGEDGTGSGTLTYATRIRAYGNVIELENYGTAPIQLTDIKRSEIH